MTQELATAGGPYSQLAPMASAFVLLNENPHGKHYDLMEICVLAGAMTAAAWLAGEIPCSRDEAIAWSMFEAAPYMSLAPLSGSVMQDLFKRGFDWLTTFVTGVVTPDPANKPHAQEAV